VLAIFVYFILPVILLCIGFPIYLILLLSSLIAVLFVADVSTTVIQTNMFGSLDNFPLLAIPFFILAGEIMGQGGIARRVIVWVTALTGSARGSLPVTTIVSSELFGAMSHTAVGTVAAVGRLVYPALKSGGYGDRFTVSLIASSGAIAVVIPPSISMILYSMSAQQSAIALFTAGILPSLLIGLVDAIYVVLYSRSRKAAVGERASWPKIWAATKEAGWALGTPVVIFGGIYGGIFTPTESGAVACIYAFLVTMFVYRDVKWSEIPKLIARVVRTVGMVMIMIGFSIAFGYMMAIMRIPAKVTEFFVAISSDKYTFLLYVNVLLLLLGTFMDLAPMLLICTPIFLPVIKTFGIDPVHFGIIMILNLGIGLLTPPVGPTMVVGCAIGRVSMEAVSRSILIFYVPMLVVLALVTYIPALSLWLPHLLLK